jgi:chaperonin GroEL
MLDGMVQLEKAVLTTLGPKGKCVLIDKNNTIPFITKDGVSVAKEVAFTDVYKNIGAQIAKDVARRTNTVAGDGTTTSTLLVVEMCKTGTELISLGFDANDIGKGMKLAKDDILNELEKVKKVISSEDEIRSVATISANNDSEIGSIICEAFTNIGDSGIVTLMNATNKQGKTSIEYSSGLEFANGFTSSVFISTLIIESSTNVKLSMPSYSMIICCCKSILGRLLISDIIVFKNTFHVLSILLNVSL